MADGRAVFRSSVREFIASEWMHAIGIPTTRALSLVTTGEGVIRDTFYDGRPAYEPGAITCRLAESFLRFGSLELPYMRDDVELESALLREALVLCPSLLPTDSTTVPLTSKLVCNWFAENVRMTATLLASWMAVGFCHGVMNTDNMSLAGLTLDYGPYGFVEAYHPRFVPNHSDQTGRYCFAQQMLVGAWNLSKLGAALQPYAEVSELESALQTYMPVLAVHLVRLLQCKFGLREWRDPMVGAVISSMPDTSTPLHRLSAASWRDQRDGAAAAWERAGGADAWVCPFPLPGLPAPFGSEAVQNVGPEMQQSDTVQIAHSFVQLLQRSQADFTNAFWCLQHVPSTPVGEHESMEEVLQPLALALRHSFAESDDAVRRGWYDWLVHYRSRLAEDSAGMETSQRGVGVSVAWSHGEGITRGATQRRANPRFVPRNYQMQQASVAAEGADLEPMRDLLAVLSNPLDLRPDDVPADCGFANEYSPANMHTAPPSMALLPEDEREEATPREIPLPGQMALGGPGATDQMRWTPQDAMEPELAHPCQEPASWHSWATDRGVSVLSCSS